MIKYVYATKNKKSSNFNAPQFTDYADREVGKQAYIIGCKESRQHEVEIVKELDFYYLGTFDTKTGKFDTLEDPDFLFSGSEVFD